MPSVYCVRADSGKFAEQFINGGYVAIGWMYGQDITQAKDREEIKQQYMKFYPDDSVYSIGQQVGQMARFFFDLVPGDYVITPPIDTEYIHYGILEEGPAYFEAEPKDGCRFQHRRPVKWIGKTQRSAFSIPFQYSLRSSLTIFQLKDQSSFFDAIGREDLVPHETVQTREQNTKMVLKKILELDYKEFELLITDLLSALGFEAEHVGKVGDDGIDAIGELDIFNMAKVKLYAQAKRYNVDSRITPTQIKQLRKEIPINAQGAFITTCDFQTKALEVATQPGFPRIGTINGEQLVDLLAEKWDALDEGLKEKLGLKKGLILE